MSFSPFSLTYFTSTTLTLQSVLNPQRGHFSSLGYYLITITHTTRVFFIKVARYSLVRSFFGTALEADQVRLSIETYRHTFRFFTFGNRSECATGGTNAVAASCGKSTNLPFSSCLAKVSFDDNTVSRIYCCTVIGFCCVSFWMIRIISRGIREIGIASGNRFGFRALGYCVRINGALMCLVGDLQRELLCGRFMRDRVVF